MVLAAIKIIAVIKMIIVIALFVSSIDFKSL